MVTISLLGWSGILLVLSSWVGYSLWMYSVAGHMSSFTSMFFQLPNHVGYSEQKEGWFFLCYICFQARVTFKESRSSIHHWLPLLFLKRHCRLSILHWSRGQAFEEGASFTLSDRVVGERKRWFLSRQQLWLLHFHLFSSFVFILPTANANNKHRHYTPSTVIQCLDY